jgi:hypothetical protein
VISICCQQAASQNTKLGSNFHLMHAFDFIIGSNIVVQPSQPHVDHKRLKVFAAPRARANNRN